MRIERHHDVRGFFERVEPFLLRREAEHNLMLGFRASLEHDPHAFGPDDPYLAAVVDERGEVVAAATMTPPHNLVLSTVDDPGAVDALAGDLRGEVLPGLIAPLDVGAAFCDRWPAAATVSIEERIYEATEVIPPRPVPGRMRFAEDRDRDVVVEFVAGFFEEALPGSTDGDAEAWVARRRSQPDTYTALWDDGGKVVTLAGFGSPTPNGMRVGPVYTPPGLRGRGYASALTAAVTEHVLASGRRFCFLFTNLANPTSNSIYRRIGYRPVLDVNVWRFARD
jgi:hypothetical protein